MKSFAKFSFSLFILLLIGYTQVFGPMYRANASDSPARQIKGHQYVQIPLVKTTELEGLETEEEFKRNALKDHSRDNTYVDFFYSELLPQFFQCLKNHSAYSGYSSCISLVGLPDLTPDILRL